MMLITVSCAAKILETSEGTVRRLERSGDLPAMRTSTGVRLFDSKRRRARGARPCGKTRRHDARGRVMAVIAPVPSPWLPLKAAAAYCGRSRRFLAREIKAGRLRAARVGGRGELLFRREWLDAWLDDLATPIVVRRRVG